MRRSLLFVCLLLSSLAFAEAEADAKSLVSTQLIKPLVAKEEKTSRFSRKMPAPLSRQVRVDDTAKRDAQGRTFVTFSVDARHDWDDDEWRKDVMTGCVYAGEKLVFVKRGADFHPAAAMAGKKTKAAASGTCEAAPVQQLTQR